MRRSTRPLGNLQNWAGETHLPADLGRKKTQPLGSGQADEHYTPPRLSGAAPAAQDNSGRGWGPQVLWLTAEGSLHSWKASWRRLTMIW